MQRGVTFMKIFCQQCGTDLKEGVVICPKCGFENKIARKKKGRFIFLALLTLIIFGLSATILLYKFNKITLPKEAIDILSKYLGKKEYSGKDLIANSISQRTEGAKNLVAWIKDSRDGKSYRIVKMPDNRWWMAENLNYQKDLVMNERSDYANSSKVENPKDGIQGIGSFWCNDSVQEWPMYEYENYDTYDYEIKSNLTKAYGLRPSLEVIKDRYPGAKGSRNQVTTIDSCSKYGAFYTWETATLQNGKGTWNPENYQDYLKTNNICPTGWKLPSDEEWANLLNTIETETNGVPNHNSVHYKFAGQYAGRLLKSIEISENPNNNGLIWQDYSHIDKLFNGENDEDSKNKYINYDYYGFSVIPAGLKTEDVYFWKSRAAYFWTSTQDNQKDAKFRSFQSEEPRVFTGQHHKARGMSIRCIKDIN